MSAPGMPPSKEWIGWDGPETVQRLRDAFGAVVLDEVVFRGERTAIVEADAVLDVLAFLRDDPQCAFDMLTDVTAVHWPGRDQPFDVAHLLYSFPRNVRFRVKCRVGDPPSVASACSVWSGANWLERECYDMFGVEFTGHPDLRRILMPEGTVGHPLRKEFPLKR